MLDEPQIQTESEVDVAAVLAELQSFGKEVPVEALRTVQRHRTLFIPQLIESIRSATAAVQTNGAPSSDVHHFALLLLNEFRAKEALPALLEAITLPGEGPFQVFGEGITEDLSITLAILAGDQLELLDSLIGDRAVNEYVRWAAVDAVTMIARAGTITRDEAANRLNQHLRRAIDTDDHELGLPLIANLGGLGVPTSRQLALEAYEKLDIDPMFTTRESIEDDFDAAASGDFSRFERIELPVPRETVEYVSGWATYTEPYGTVEREKGFDERYESEEEFVDFDDVPEPIHAPAKVGRNEACPCGSGKKYKKCCGRHASDTGVRLTP